jgi:hypothetical protein
VFKWLRVSGKCMILHDKELYDLCRPPNEASGNCDAVISWTYSEMGRTRNTYKILVEKLRALGRPK